MSTAEARSSRRPPDSTAPPPPSALLLARRVLHKSVSMLQADLTLDRIASEHWNEPTVPQPQSNSHSPTRAPVRERCLPSTRARDSTLIECLRSRPSQEDLVLKYLLRSVAGGSATPPAE